MTPQNHTSVICPQCMSIFSGRQNLRFSDSKWPPPTHHPSVGSFETAVRSGCVICYRTLVGLQKKGFNDLHVFEEQSPFSNWILRERAADFDLEILVCYPDDASPRSDSTRSPPWFTLRQIVLSSKRYDGPTQGVSADYSTSTASEESWDRACSWYAQCRNHHEICQENRGRLSFLPTRVLDINNEEAIRLVTGKDRAVHDYATLSHRWGGSDIICLRTSNMAQLQDSINIGDLPQTFKDAIGVARKLGIFYLWIDSLCIIQDDLEDWQNESALMGEVYSNGVLNIMATASTDSHQGLYRDRDPRELQHCSFKSSWTDIEPDTLNVLSNKTWENLINQAPLNRRGWVLQERILAPRALHFAENQLAWECRAMDACEMYPDRVPRVLENLHSRVKLTDPSTYQNWVATWRDYDPAGHVGYDVWGRIVKLYGGTRLTKEADRLVAISGLAKRMRSILKDQYLAGLWANHLPYQLIWHTTSLGREGSTGRRATKYRAPSWSWAAIEGEVAMIMIERTANPEVLIEIEEAKVLPLSDIDDTAEVIAGYVRLKCRLFKAELLGRDEDAQIYNLKLRADGMVVGGVIYPDEPVTAKHTSVVLLPMYRENGKGQSGFLYSLILKSVEGHPQGWYSRVGVTSSWADATDDESWGYISEQLEEPEIKDESLYLEQNPRSIMLI